MISLIWQFLTLRREIRQRLRVASTRGATGGVDAIVQYKPLRSRVGLKAKVTLLDPPDGELAGVDRQERADRYGVYAAKLVDETARGSSIEVELKNLQPDPPGQFAGLFSVTGGGGRINAARVRIEIWAAGPMRLESREVTVRAINI